MVHCSAVRGDLLKCDLHARVFRRKPPLKVAKERLNNLRKSGGQHTNEPFPALRRLHYELTFSLSHLPFSRFFSQVSVCILATGSGTARRACGSCNPKTWPPATWCYPAAAWSKLCSLSSPKDKQTWPTTSAPPLTRQRRSPQEGDDV